MKNYVYYAWVALLVISCKSDLQDVTRPDENRFTPVVLTPDGSLDEPMGFEITAKGKVFIYERKGDLKMFDPLTELVTLPSR